jgi:hypothetical protein
MLAPSEEREQQDQVTWIVWLRQHTSLPHRAVCETVNRSAAELLVRSLRLTGQQACLTAGLRLEPRYPTP